MAASVGVIVANIYYAQPLLPEITRTFGLSAAGIGVFAEGWTFETRHSSGSGSGSRHPPRSLR
jgi:hypothetical protein